MIINWYGEGCFKIQTGGLTLLTDPFLPSIGLTPPRGKNEATIKTLTALPVEANEKEGGQIIRGAGTYEIQGIIIDGFQLPKESSDKFIKSVYKIVAEDIIIGLLGHISDELSVNASEALKNIDILIIPAAGKPFINQATAAKLIKQLNPKIVIASFFKTPGLKRTSSDWKNFSDEVGQKPEIMEKLSIRKKELTEQKGMKFIVLRI